MEPGQLGLISDADGGFAVYVFERAPLDAAALERKPELTARIWKASGVCFSRLIVRPATPKVTLARPTALRLCHPQAVELFEEATGDIALGEIDAAVAKYRECVRLDPEY